MRRLAIAFVMVAAASAAEASPRQVVITPPPPAAAPPVSRVIYLERCVGGCLVKGGGANDAKNLTSTIPNPGNYNVTEFENGAHQKGSVADAEWGSLVQCVKEVYSPFDVTVTDVKPTSGTYHLALIAGLPQQVGLEANVLGVAPLASNCAAFDNVMSFSFANAHPQIDPEQHMLNVCWTAAQESAHAFGLDHEFEFVNGHSACSDPMTYRSDCGGEKFFRNTSAKCGREMLEACRCTQTQNSHRTLVQLFGAGTPLNGAPTVMMTSPSDGTLPANVIVTASAKRGIQKVSLFLNGFPMVELPGVEFGFNGQPSSSYGLVVPTNTPGSIYDMFVRASDDLGTFTDTPTTTVTHGTPCTSADTCLAEQKCEAGRCFWDPAVGELGDACTYPQFCKSLQCRGTADTQICTQACEVDDPQGCPSGLECTQGICFLPAGGGCCSSSREQWMPAGLLAFLGLVGMLRRRRT